MSEPEPRAAPPLSGVTMKTADFTTFSYSSAVSTSCAASREDRPRPGKARRVKTATEFRRCLMTEVSPAVCLRHTGQAGSPAINKDYIVNEVGAGSSDIITTG